MSNEDVKKEDPSRNVEDFSAATDAKGAVEQTQQTANIRFRKALSKFYDGGSVTEFFDEAENYFTTVGHVELAERLKDARKDIINLGPEFIKSLNESVNEIVKSAAQNTVDRKNEKVQESISTVGMIRDTELGWANTYGNLHVTASALLNIVGQALSSFGETGIGNQLINLAEGLRPDEVDPAINQRYKDGLSAIDPTIDPEINIEKASRKFGDILETVESRVEQQTASSYSGKFGQAVDGRSVSPRSEIIIPRERVTVNEDDIERSVPQVQPLPQDESPVIVVEP